MSPKPRQWLFVLYRKLHIYVGLFLLLSTWLFCGSGLLLNHSGWRFAEFWNNRREATVQRPIQFPSSSDDLSRARELMHQLGMAGEIEWTETGSKSADTFGFRVEQPGHITDIKASRSNGTASIHEIRFNAWGILRAFHTFTGVRASTNSERDWALTWLWSISMDALAAGLIFLVATSLVMAWERKERWGGSVVALVLGVAIGWFFVFGLRLI